MFRIYIYLLDIILDYSLVFTCNAISLCGETYGFIMQTEY